MFLHLEVPDILRIHVYFVLVKVELTEDIVFGLSHIGFFMLIYPISVSSILASSFWISHYWLPHLEGSQDQMNDDHFSVVCVDISDIGISSLTIHGGAGLLELPLYPPQR